MIDPFAGLYFMLAFVVRPHYLRYNLATRPTETASVFLSATQDYLCYPHHAESFTNIIRLVLLQFIAGSLGVWSLGK